MKEKIEKLKKYTILFVEDEVDISSIISDTLKKLQLNFYIASNGQEALEIYNNNKNINLVITDINMPIMNGIELIRNIRQQDKDIICMIMSAHTETSYKEDALQLGVKYYIEKPFDFINFINLVSEF